MAANVNDNVPLNYEAAVLSAGVGKWQDATQNEFISLEKNWGSCAFAPGKRLKKRIGF